MLVPNILSFSFCVFFVLLLMRFLFMYPFCVDFGMFAILYVFVCTIGSMLFIFIAVMHWQRYPIWILYYVCYFIRVLFVCLSYVFCVNLFCMH